MNHNFIFVFVLLVTLSMVNAIPLNKRATIFDACPVDPPISPLTVSITPDPPVAGQDEKFVVSGTLKHDITASVTILVIGFTADGTSPLIDPYTQNFTESVKAGTKFSITADKVPTPSQFPSSYLITVIVGDPTKIDPYGCAFATECPYPITK